MNAVTTIETGLTITRLRKEFNVNGNRLGVLRNIDLTVPQGEFVSIIGGSGCGKSTLLRIIAGLEREFEGSVRLNGTDINGPGTDRGIVFQEPRLFPWLSVRENVAFGLGDGKWDGNHDTIRRHIDLVGLNGFEQVHPHQLSGGMAQRAAIARALVNRPQLLLLDEPFGALDALTKIQMQQEVLRIWKAEGATMILVTHDIDEAVFLGDRVIIMSERPGTIRRIVSVDLPRPRDRGSLEFTRLRREIYTEFFRGEEPPFAYAI